MPTRLDSFRIMHIAAPAPVGGLESVVVALALGHRHRGLDVEVVALLSPDSDAGPFLTPLEAGGVKVHRVLNAPRAYLQERQEVQRILISSKPDIVHTHGHRADILHSGVARKLGIGTVTTIHGASRISWQSGIFELVQFWLGKRFDAVVAVSRPLAHALQRSGVPEDRIRLVPNAWDGRHHSTERARAREKLNLPQSAFVFGWVGRLIPIKGADIFLKALSLMEDPTFIASIIGDGPERDRLGALSDSLGIRERVRFHGRIDDAARYFSAFDAFVLSSRSEGTPMVLLEAMAARIPIIATAVGGVPDVVSDLEALLVRPEDPEHLATSLRAAVDGTVNLESRAKKAFRKLKHSFDREQWLDQHEVIYSHATRRCGGKSTWS